MKQSERIEMRMKQRQRDRKEKYARRYENKSLKFDERREHAQQEDINNPYDYR